MHAACLAKRIGLRIGRIRTEVPSSAEVVVDVIALSATTEDIAANRDLLTSRKWIDLAIIYATGKRAIITLEKDDKAEQLFKDVFAAWTATASAQ